MAYSGCFFVVLRLGVFGKAVCPVKISRKMDRYSEQPVLEKQRRRCFVIYEERKEETNREKQAESESEVSRAAFRRFLNAFFMPQLRKGTLSVRF